MKYIIEVLRGCDRCGDSKYLQPDECLCDKCLIQSIRKDLQELENEFYIPQDFRAKLRQKYQQRLDKILARNNQN